MKKLFLVQAAAAAVILTVNACFGLAAGLCAAGLSLAIFCVVILRGKPRGGNRQP